MIEQELVCLMHKLYKGLKNDSRDDRSSLPEYLMALAYVNYNFALNKTCVIMFIDNYHTDVTTVINRSHLRTSQ